MSLFTVAAYSASLAAGATNTDITAAADTVLQSRNNHLIMSEPFNLLAAQHIGVGATRARFGNVALTVRGTNHVWPPHRTATQPSRPRLFDLRDTPMVLPLNEEITLEGSQNDAAAQQQNVILFLGKPAWNRNQPSGLDRFVTRATFTPAAGAAGAWGALTTITMERDLFNGVYAIVGASVVNAGSLAFRIFFPSGPCVEGRQLRPGGLTNDALGDFPHESWKDGWGELGRFHTFELPQFQLFGPAAAAATEVRLALIYLGSSLSLLTMGR